MIAYVKKPGSDSELASIEIDEFQRKLLAYLKMCLISNFLGQITDEILAYHNYKTANKVNLETFRKVFALKIHKLPIEISVKRVELKFKSILYQSYSIAKHTQTKRLQTLISAIRKHK